MRVSSGDRCTESHRERAWRGKNENQGKGQLAWMLHGDGRECMDNCTQEEATITATVIQWLGSPVVSEWLRETVEKANVAK